MLQLPAEFEAEMVNTYTPGATELFQEITPLLLFMVMPSIPPEMIVYVTLPPPLLMPGAEDDPVFPC